MAGSVTSILDLSNLTGQINEIIPQIPRPLAQLIRDYLTRPSSPIIYRFGGDSSDAVQSTALSLDTSQSCTVWESLPPMPLAQISCSAVMYNGTFVVTGGAAGNMLKPDVQQYDPTTRMWTNLPPLIVHRMGHATLVCRNQLYVLGGTHKGGKVLDVKQSKWVPLPEMHSRQRIGFTAIEYNDKIYVFGGDLVVTVECFDPSTQKWTCTKHVPRVNPPMFV